MEIIHNGQTIFLDDDYVDDLKKSNIELTSSYINELLDNDTYPIVSLGLQLLIRYDQINKKYIGSTGILGRIVKVDKKSNPIAYFETTRDAIMDSLNNKEKYVFEHPLIRSTQTYNFFETSIKPCENTSADNELKRLVNLCRRTYFGKRRIVNDLYEDNTKLKNTMTFEEFKSCFIKYRCFIFGDILRSLYTYTEYSFPSHDINKCSDYESKLNNLFLRYSINNQSAFKEVKILQDYHSVSGIYILCLSKIKGCYIGQSDTDLASAIVEHFSNPISLFDHSYTPHDIDKVFVLPLDETMEFSNEIIADCMTCLGANICLNALPIKNSKKELSTEDNTAQLPLEETLIEQTVNDSLEYYQYILSYDDEDDEYD